MATSLKPLGDRAIVKPKAKPPKARKGFRFVACRIDESGNATPVGTPRSQWIPADEEAESLNNSRDRFEREEGYTYEARKVPK